MSRSSEYIRLDSDREDLSSKRGQDLATNLVRDLVTNLVDIQTGWFGTLEKTVV